MLGALAHWPLLPRPTPSFWCLPRILVVDDAEETNVLVEMRSVDGHRVETAADGVVASRRSSNGATI